MAPLIGMVIALPAEAAALTGRKDWRSDDGSPCRRRTLPGGVDLAIGLSGMGPERGRQAARRLIEDGAAALIQLGVSGGLAPHLVTGDLVIADSVLLVDGGRIQSRWQTDAELARQALDRLSAGRVPAALGPIVSSPQPLLTPALKRGIGEEFQALAVDMESAGVAMAAEENGRCCCIVRAVCDAADQPVPVWLFHTLNVDGSVRFARLGREIVRHPSAVAELCRMRQRFRKACGALRDAWNLLGTLDFLSLLAAGQASRR